MARLASYLVFFSLLAVISVSGRRRRRCCNGNTGKVFGFDFDITPQMYKGNNTWYWPTNYDWLYWVQELFSFGLDGSDDIEYESSGDQMGYKPTDIEGLLLAARNADGIFNPYRGCLTADRVGSEIVLKKCTSSQNQIWDVKEINPSLKYFKFYSLYFEGYCAEMSSNGKIFLNLCSNNLASQEWKRMLQPDAEVTGYQAKVLYPGWLNRKHKLCLVSKTKSNKLSGASCKIADEVNLEDKSNCDVSDHHDDRDKKVICGTSKYKGITYFQSDDGLYPIDDSIVSQQIDALLMPEQIKVRGENKCVTYKEKDKYVYEPCREKRSQQFLNYPVGSTDTTFLARNLLTNKNLGNVDLNWFGGEGNEEDNSLQRADGKFDNNYLAVNEDGEDVNWGNDRSKAASIEFTLVKYSKLPDYVLKDTGYQYTGRFCRTTSKGSEKTGKFISACFTDKDRCTLEQCREKCDDMKKCQGFEYSYRKRKDKITCELHTTSVDYAEGDDFTLDRCYNKEVAINPDNFEYLGRFCRTREGSKSTGVFQAACRHDSNQCTLQECEKKCANSPTCEGYEYSFRKRKDKITCELHQTRVDFAEDDSFNEDRCFKKVSSCTTSFRCPANSSPENSCPKNIEDCKCKDGFEKQGNQCRVACNTSFRCPSNSSPNNSCPKNINDCKCKDGFKKEGNQCVGGGEYTYLGRFCRTRKGKKEEGKYKKACFTHKKQCTLNQCEALCSKSKKCQGYEYSFRQRKDKVTCELHKTPVDFAEGDSFNEDRCFQKNN